jgi:LytR cell envelope-related transcriptional attenuator
VEFGSLVPPQGVDQARRRLRRRVLVIVLVVGSGVAWFGIARRNRTSRGMPSPVPTTTRSVQRPERIIGDSLRITVEVVNATEVRGLGRQATAWLRDVGFDVVNTTTAPEKDRRDSSMVLFGSGHPEWAALAARSMGGARIEARPDSLRYIDLTVIVGRSWRPPPQTLYP